MSDQVPDRAHIRDYIARARAAFHDDFHYFEEILRTARRKVETLNKK